MISPTNVPLPDRESRHAFLWAFILDRDYTPGLLKAVTKNDHAWAAWKEWGKGGYEAVAAVLLNVAYRDDATHAPPARSTRPRRATKGAR